MPEGDTVYQAAQRLRALDGEVLTTSDFRVPQHATADLVGATVTTTVSRGKHLLTRFAPADGWPGVTLHTHLKMEGVWHVHPPGGRWRRPAYEARVVLRTADHEAVGFALGVVALVPTAEEETVVGHLGPDLLGPDWDEDEAVRRMTADPDRTVGEVLLDQTCLAGVGSVYRSELCFVAGLHPHTPIGTVADATTPGPASPADARAQQDAHRPHHDRRHPPGPAALGLRQARPAVPSLRHARTPRRDGPRGSGTGRLLVPELPARAIGRREGPGHAPRALLLV